MAEDEREDLHALARRIEGAYETWRRGIERFRELTSCRRPEGAKGEAGYIEVGPAAQRRKISWANSRACQLLGGELAGRRPTDIMPESARGDYDAAVANPTGTYLGVYQRARALRLDGTEIAVVYVVSGGRDPDGRRRYLCKIWEVSVD